MPIALVAIIGDEVCGAAALKMESVTTYPDYFPWLAGLLVALSFRRQGIGEQLNFDVMCFVASNCDLFSMNEAAIKKGKLL